MPRTRNARREEVTTPNPAPTDERAEMESPQAPPLPPPALLEVPHVGTHPAVVEAQRRLTAGEEAVRVAERRLEETRRASTAAHDALLQARAKFALGEIAPEDLDRAATAVEEAVRAFTAAQEDLQTKQAALGILRDRLQQATEQARVETEATLKERRRDLARRIAEGMVALAPLARELFFIERAAREQGFPLEGDWCLALLELVNVEGHRPVTNPDYVFGYHPADGSLLAEYLKRLKKIGIEVEPPQPVALADLLGRPW